MNHKKFTEGKTEMEYNGNIHLNDPNWDIIKKYRIVDSEGNRKYTFLAKCKKCGFEKEVSNSGLYKGLIFCPQCSEQSEIGKIYGIFEILDFDHRANKKKYYKVKCTKCGDISIRALSDIQHSKSVKCKNCDKIGNNRGFNRLYSQYIAGAKKRNIDFNLSPEEFYNIVTQNCHYCGQEPTERTTDIITAHNTNIHYSAITNGIDRIDSSKGYFVENCVPCCEKCNKMKLDHSTKTFFSHIKKIYEFNKLDNINLEVTQLI